MKTRLTVYDYTTATDIQRFGMDVDEAMKSADGSVSDEVQMMLFERAAWEQKNLQKIRKQYQSAGATMPPELLKPLGRKVAALRTQIERDAPTRG